MKRIKRTLVFSLKTLPHTVIVMAEVMVVLSVIMALVVTVFLAKLAQSPIDLSFAKTSIAEALSSAGHDMRVDFDRADLSWPGASGPFHLKLSGLKLIENGQDLASIRDVELLIARAPLLWGHIRPVRLIVDSPDIGVMRDVDRQFRLSLIPKSSETSGAGQPQGQAQIVQPKQKSDPSKYLTDQILNRLFETDLKDNTILGQIEEVEIRNARAQIIDRVLDMTWEVQRVNLLFQEVDVGVMGTAHIELANGQNLSLKMTYQRARDEFSITSSVQDFSLFELVGRVLGIDLLRRQQIPLTGKLEMQGKLNPVQIDVFGVKAEAHHGIADIGDGQDRIELPVSDLKLDLSYDRTKTGWNMSTFNFNAAGVPVRIGAILSQDESGAYQGAVQLKISKINQDTIVSLWPDSYRDDGIGKWMTHKLSGAIFTNTQIDVPIWAGLRDGRMTMSVLPPRAQWSFEKLKADYHAPLMPITNGSGTGTYDNDTITIKVATGDVQDLKVDKGTVTLTDVTKAGAGEAYIDMTLTGPIRTMLRYISDEPIALSGKIPVAVDMVEGQGTYHALVSFPTLKDLPKDLVKADVDAIVSDLVLPKMIKGQTISGGPFTMTGKAGVLTVTGQGKIAGRDMMLNWVDPITPGEKGICTKGTITVDTSEALRRAAGVNISGLFGSTPMTIDYQDCFKGSQTAIIKADLTPTRVYIPMMGYEKEIGKAGTAAATITMYGKNKIDIKNLDAKMPDVSIKKAALDLAALPDGTIGITKATLPDYKFKNSSGAIIYNQYKNRMAIDIAGPAFDLGPFLSGPSSDTTTSPPLNVKINVDRLGFGGVSVLEQAALNVTMNENAALDRMNITGRAGIGDISINYVPDSAGRMTLNVNAADAGAFLRVLNVYDNVQGGTLTLNGVPIGNNSRDVKGVLVMRHFSVIKAPVLAQLLGSMSIKGLGEQLTNQGIGFDRLESGFALVRRSGQDLMSFREGRTSGSSLGITFDGLYDRRKGMIDVSGTIIPVSGVNKMASKIPLFGRLIAGGDDSALFAVTYNVKGPVENPKTLINPLAVLTPGILRRLFFEDRPDDPLATPKSRLND